MKCSEGECNGLYSLAFVGAALGALIFIRSFTGNVVGFGGSASIVGVVLLVFGLAFALVISSSRWASF
jgi:hypothetical protein